MRTGWYIELKKKILFLFCSMVETEQMRQGQAEILGILKFESLYFILLSNFYFLELLPCVC